MSNNYAAARIADQHAFPQAYRENSQLLYDLKRFVVESWKIEGLDLGFTISTLAAYHQQWVMAGEVTVDSLCHAATKFVGPNAKLRDWFGLNVRVGSYRPPEGGPEIRESLRALCARATSLSPYELHKEFEKLHPFMDGNGRVGRLLWLWSMKHHSLDASRGFLHTWYYQSLASQEST